MRTPRVNRMCSVHFYRATDQANLLCNYAPIKVLMTNCDCHFHVWAVRRSMPMFLCWTMNNGLPISQSYMYSSYKLAMAPHHFKINIIRNKQSD